MRQRTVFDSAYGISPVQNRFSQSVHPAYPPTDSNESGRKISIQRFILYLPEFTFLQSILPLLFCFQSGNIRYERNDGSK